MVSIRHPRGFGLAIGTVLLMVAYAQSSCAGELWVGAGMTDITPKEPIALQGQFHVRIARNAETPLTATALAIESREGDRPVDQAILIACDLTLITLDLQEKLRERVHAAIPGFDVRKLILTATHTHTAPVLDDFWYVLPKEGVMLPPQYVGLLVERLSRLAADVWSRRQPGGGELGPRLCCRGAQPAHRLCQRHRGDVRRRPSARFPELRKRRRPWPGNALLLGSREAPPGRGHQRRLPVARGGVAIDDQRRFLARRSPAVDRAPQGSCACWAGRRPPATSRPT